MRSNVERLLTRGAVTAVAQPVVRLSDNEVLGYEVLARMPGTGRGPDHWLRRADDFGLRAELEVACLRSLPELGPPPEGATVFVNVSVATLSTRQARELLLGVKAPLVLELSNDEAHPPDFAGVREILEPYVAAGARVAIDDTGTGFTSLQHVYELRPAFLKVSTHLVRRLQDDPGRQSLVRALVAFAREVGAAVIAEGVETAEEHDALVEAEVDLAQGFWFARPSTSWPRLRMHAVPPPRQPSGRRSEITGLLEATDAAAACNAVADHLFRRDGLMPSIYLERGGRLRCESARGYWQIFDGIPAGTGVIGTTFATGVRSLIRKVGQSEDYLEAVPGVEDELCVPIRVDNRVVGCVNVESFTSLSGAAERVVDACAALLGERLALLGLPTETPAQKLGRHAADLADLAGRGTERDLHEAVLRAAIEVSGLDSAAICLFDEDQPKVVEADGLLAGALMSLPDGMLDLMRSWIHSGTSSYTIGRTGGVGFPGQEKLRADGVNSLALLPLSGPVATVPGFIVVAAQEIVTLDTEHLALLELLAAEVTACLRVAVGVRDLRDKADRDPLTGLGHYGSFQDLLPNARRSAQDRRLAVLYVDVDHFKQVNDSAGHAEGDRLLMTIAAAMQRALRGRDLVFRMGGDEFAALAEVVSDEEALAVGHRLREAVLEATGTSLSIGVAVASPTDSDESLLKRADEALYLVKHSGRGAVHLLAAPDEATA